MTDPTPLRRHLVAGCLTGVLAGSVVHTRSVLRDVHGVRGIGLVVVVVVASVAYLVGRRLDVPGGSVSTSDRHRLGALVLVHAALAGVAAGHAPVAQASAALAVVAALLVGVAVSATGDTEDTGPMGWALAAAALGVLVVIVGPVFYNALAVFVRDRIWVWAVPETSRGIRTTSLIIGAAGVAGAVELMRRADASDRAVDVAHRAGSAASPSPRRETPADAVLAVRDLVLRYGTSQVLFGVDVHVGPGESVALLGTNGAGKSSVLRAVTGLTRPTSGRIVFGGEDITALVAHARVRRGLVHVPGGQGIFPSLSVRDNLRMVAIAAGERRHREAEKRLVAAQPWLAERLLVPARDLSGGERQLLTLARAWILRPKLLTIDEFTLGLSASAIDRVVEMVDDLRREGVAMLIVEQSLDVAERVATRGIFLQRGAVHFDGPVEELRGRPDLVHPIFLRAAS